MAVPWVALVGPEIEENLSLRYLSASLRRAGRRAVSAAWGPQTE